MSVAVERLVNVALKGLLGVPSWKCAAEFEPQIVHNQGFAQKVESAGSQPYCLRQRTFATEWSTDH